VLRWTDPAAMDGFMKLVMASGGRSVGFNLAYDMLADYGQFGR
jgi:hypothetical protein